MSNFQMSGRLPGKEKNALADVEDQFFEVDAPEPMLAVVQIVRDSRTVKDGSDEVKAIARIARLELLPSDLVAKFSVWMEQEAARRAGDGPMLEFDEPEAEDFMQPLVAGVDGMTGGEER